MNSTNLTDKFQGWQKRARASAKNLGQTTDAYLRENPWSTLAVAVFLGCILGYLLTSDRE
jgi:ElaB/YqjD/DUF883 family membrane-anchored ribosome-binding protein